MTDNNNNWGVPNVPETQQNYQPQGYAGEQQASQNGNGYQQQYQAQYPQNDGVYQQQYQAQYPQNGAAYQQPQQNWGGQQPSSWGGVQSNYYAGYATVLRVFVILGSFVLPLIIWAIVGFSLAEQTDGGSLLLAILGYAVTAFILWVLLSYKAKQFDLLSRIAKNTEAVYRELEKMNGRQ